MGARSGCFAERKGFGRGLRLVRRFGCGRWVLFGGWGWGKGRGDGRVRERGSGVSGLGRGGGWCGGYDGYSGGGEEGCVLGGDVVGGCGGADAGGGGRGVGVDVVRWMRRCC